jgi:hypothetical protein
MVWLNCIYIVLYLLNLGLLHVLNIEVGASLISLFNFLNHTLLISKAFFVLISVCALFFSLRKVGHLLCPRTKGGQRLVLKPGLGLQTVCAFDSHT